MIEHSEFANLMLRMNARRVAAAYQRAGLDIPPGAAAILGDDHAELHHADNRLFRDWCESNGLECFLLVDGNFDFSPAPDHPSFGGASAASA